MHRQPLYLSIHSGASEHDEKSTENAMVILLHTGFVCCILCMYQYLHPNKMAQSPALLGPLVHWNCDRYCVACVFSTYG